MRGGLQRCLPMASLLQPRKDRACRVVHESESHLHFDVGHERTLTMELRCDKTELGKLLHRVVGLTRKQNAIGYECCVLVKGYGDCVEVCASDPAMTITARGTAEVKEAGSIAVCAADLLERVMSLPRGPVTLAVGSAQRVSLISSGARWFRLSGLDGDAYPMFRKHASTNATTFELDIHALATLLAHVEPSISRKQIKPEFEVALLKSTGTALVSVSTDGHRLIKDECPVAARQAVATLALRSVQMLRRLANENGKVFVSVGAKNVAFTFPWGEVISVNAGATYPEWERIIPASFTRSALVDRQALLEVVQAMTVTTEGTECAIQIHLQPGRMRLCAENKKRKQDSEDEVPITYEGDAFTFGCSGEYLLDALNVLEGNTVHIGLNGPLDPVIITAAGNKTAVCVVMPRRIGAAA